MRDLSNCFLNFAASSEEAGGYEKREGVLENDVQIKFPTGVLK